MAKGIPFRNTMPFWARAHEAVVRRCVGDIAFRMEVLSATTRERPPLILAASEWAKVDASP